MKEARVEAFLDRTHDLHFCLQVQISFLKHRVTITGEAAGIALSVRGASSTDRDYAPPAISIPR